VRAQGTQIQIVDGWLGFAGGIPRSERHAFFIELADSLEYKAFPAGEEILVRGQDLNGRPRPFSSHFPPFPLPVTFARLSSFSLLACAF